MFVFVLRGELRAERDEGITAMISDCLFDDDAIVWHPSVVAEHIEIAVAA